MINNPKILLFIDQLGPGGAQRQIVGLARLLKGKNINVKVCYYHPINFYNNILDDYDIEHQVIPNAVSKYWRIIRVFKYFQKENPDWVIAYLDAPSIISSIVKLHGCRYRLIVSDRNTTINVKLKDKLKFNLWRFADYIVPNSFSQEKVIIKNVKTIAKKTVTIPNFVDLVHFSQKESLLRHSVPQIIVVSSINQHKNTLGLIEALRIVINKGYHCEIKWYGVGAPMSKDYLCKCENKIKECNLQNNFFLLDKTKEINKKYTQADYMCLPSFYEGTSNAICEAMSCGLPLIVSNICDNPYYAIEGFNGFLFDPYSPSAIAESIINAISMDDKAYIAYCHNSRKKAEECFDEERFVNDYLNLIEM